MELASVWAKTWSWVTQIFFLPRVFYTNFIVYIFIRWHSPSIMATLSRNREVILPNSLCGVVLYVRGRTFAYCAWSSGVNLQQTRPNKQWRHLPPHLPLMSGITRPAVSGGKFFSGCGIRNSWPLSGEFCAAVTLFFLIEPAHCGQLAHRGCLHTSSTLLLLVDVNFILWLPPWLGHLFMTNRNLWKSGGGNSTRYSLHSLLDPTITSIYPVCLYYHLDIILK